MINPQRGVTISLRYDVSDAKRAGQAIRNALNLTVSSRLNNPTFQQKIKAAERAVREVERINAQTARQAEQQEKIRERAAKTLADVQTREARRAANEILIFSHFT